MGSPPAPLPVGPSAPPADPSPDGRSPARPSFRVWTVMDVVRWSAPYLLGKGVKEGRLDCEHILASVLGLERLQLYLCFDRPLTKAELVDYKVRLKRRAAREPLQYILESAPFRNRILKIGPGVAIPRPETEYFIDVLLDVAGRDRIFASALDVGTGSGALAVALADEGLARSVTAVDISLEALKLARSNAADAGIFSVNFRQGSLLEPVVGETFDLVLSNPPYVSCKEWREAEPEVRDWEPRDALVGGPDGLEVVRRLVPGLSRVLRPGGWVGLEVGRFQTEAVARLFRGTGWAGKIEVREDLAGRSRYVFAQAAGKRPSKGYRPGG